MGRGAAVALVVVAAAVWGTAGAVQEAATPQASPVAVAAVRCALGGAVLLVLALARRQGLAGLRRRRAALALAIGAMLVFQVGYLGGIRASGVAVGTLVAIGSAPVWAGVLAALRGRRPRGRWWAATVLTVAGLAAITGPGSASIEMAGVAASAAAGLGYATYVAATAELRVDTDPVAMLGVLFTACGVLLLLSPAGRQLGGLDGTAIAGHLWLGLGTIALGYLLFVAGLRDVDAPTATTLTLAEPLTATLLAVTLLGEALTGVGLAGGLVLLGGLVLAARAGAAPARVPPGPSILGRARRRRRP